MRCLLAFVACALALTVPATALAQETNAPPGNSGIDEYLETVPSASGDRPAAGGGGQAGGRSERLPEQAARALRGRGEDGKAVADLVRASPSPPHGPRRGDAARPQRVDEVAEPHGDSPFASVARAVRGAGDSDGMGAALPAILIGGLAVLGGALVVRLTRRGSAP